jgi:hypothetical protein
MTQMDAEKRSAKINERNEKKKRNKSFPQISLIIAE